MLWDISVLYINISIHTHTHIYVEFLGHWGNEYSSLLDINKLLSKSGCFCKLRVLIVIHVHQQTSNMFIWKYISKPLLLNGFVSYNF